ncbi:hypothetical protein BKA93DRAFT_820741 [Sparassis latifolia]
MPVERSDPRIRRYLHRIRISANAVYEYGCDKGGLRVWYWPVNSEGERVTPSDLDEHRKSHRIHNPCCLCPLIADGREAVEAAIFVPLRGRATGEYVAACAKSSCGYYVHLERIYAKTGLPVRYYPPRDELEPVPAPVEIHANVQIEERRIADAPQRTRGQSHTEALVQLLRLNSSVRPGLEQADFEALFLKCTCSLIMMRMAFCYHECAVQKHAHQEIAVQEVIDLTIDDSDEDA